MMPRHSPTVVSVLLLLAACGHDDPFATPPADRGQPFAPTSPVRLTFNPLDDRTPSWLPDGSGIVYSTEAPDRADHDRCIAVLPPVDAAGPTTA